MKLFFFCLVLCSTSLFAQQNDTLPVFYLDEIYVKENPLPDLILNKLRLKKELFKIPASKLKIIEFNEALEPVRVIDRLGPLRQKKIGYVNKRGNFVIPFKYDRAFTNFKQGLAIVGKRQNFIDPEIYKGVINKKNEIIVPLLYTDIGKISEELIPVKNAESLWGFYNRKGQVTDCIFSDYKANSNGTFSVNQNGKWGLLNEAGSKLLDIKYKNIIHLSSDSFSLENFPQWLLKNRRNENISVLQFDSIFPIDSGVYKYEIGHRYGLVQSNGQLITNADFERVRDFKNDVAIIKKEGKYGLMKNNGKIIISPFYSSIDFIDSTHVKILGSVAKKYGPYAKIFDQKRWGIYTIDGSEIYPCQYLKIGKLSNEVIPAMGNKNKWGYINLLGDTIIPFEYNEAESFINGLALVTARNGVKHYINKKGKVVVDPLDVPLYKAGICNEKDSSCMEFFFPYSKYEDYRPIALGYVMVKNKSKYGALNRQGMEIIPPVYDSIRFVNEEQVFIVHQDTNTGMIDRYGKIFFLNNKFDKISDYADGLYKVTKGNVYGFIDKKGIVRISMQYPEITDFKEGFAAAVIKGKWGFINKYEELVVQPFYTEVRPFRHGTAAVKTKDKKWNLIDTKGKELHSLGYDEIREGEFDKWIIIRNGKIGLADSTGKEMVSTKYDNVQELGNGFFKVLKAEKVGVLDKDENFVLPIEFDNLDYDMLSDVFIVKLKGTRELKVLKEEEK